MDTLNFRLRLEIGFDGVVHQNDLFRCDRRVEAVVQEWLIARQLPSSTCKRHGVYPDEIALCVCTFFGVSQEQAWQQRITKGFAALLRCKSILILVISHLGHSTAGKREAGSTASTSISAKSNLHFHFNAFVFEGIDAAFCISSFQQNTCHCLRFLAYSSGSLLSPASWFCVPDRTRRVAARDGSR
ncbi:hypothetical protein [Paraburkholderia madseniana]|uniref:hypothetical protein n=1 Tax=Paraburkholderia madseniana TaxID=2599607 RepID=UPI0018EB2EA9|nr:hypothetical protein [Paraburkholderia madseniana]